mmetsp:Transcript_32483/g.103636  ORF Transcript_32483/g.103636 Transcript_32483/m.103636 type:complete len:311 (-) Transcript_32483:497-1429(-)
MATRARAGLAGGVGIGVVAELLAAGRRVDDGRSAPLARDGAGAALLLLLLLPLEHRSARARPGALGRPERPARPAALAIRAVGRCAADGGVGLPAGAMRGDFEVSVGVELRRVRHHLVVKLRVAGSVDRGVCARRDEALQRVHVADAADRGPRIGAQLHRTWRVERGHRCGIGRGARPKRAERLQRRGGLELGHHALAFLNSTDRGEGFVGGNLISETSLQHGLRAVEVEVVQRAAAALGQGYRAAALVLALAAAGARAILAERQAKPQECLNGGGACGRVGGGRRLQFLAARRRHAAERERRLRLQTPS